MPPIPRTASQIAGSHPDDRETRGERLNSSWIDASVVGSPWEEQVRYDGDRDHFRHRARSEYDNPKMAVYGPWVPGPAPSAR